MTATPPRPGTLPAATLLWAVVVGVSCDPALAYSKFEHEQLTYYAFEIAKDLVCGRSPMPETCTGFDEILRAADEEKEVASASTKLGTVTRAVDYFTHPWRLAPDAGDCLEPGRARSPEGGCRKSMAERCAELKLAAEVEGASDAGDRCLEYALEDTLRRVHNRRSNRLYRALAVHRNDEHFRQGARDEYNRMHRRAMDLVEQRHFGLALISEAIAIHFLQDGFSPGHLAAPRDQYGDSHAGAMHDRWNTKGLRFWADPEICTQAQDLVAPLARLVEGEERTRGAQDYRQVTRKVQDEPDRRVEPSDLIPLAKQIPPDDLLADLREFTHACSSEPLTYTAFGDKRLLAGPPRSSHPSHSREAKRNHRVSLLTLAVLSIQDVLAREADLPPLRLCFHPPSVLDPSAGPTPANRRFWAPGLAIGRERDRYEPLPCWKPQQAQLIFGYETGPPPPRPEGAAEAQQRSWALSAGAHRVNSVQAAVSYWGQERRRFELGYDAFASEKYWGRTPDGRLTVGREAQRKGVVTLGSTLHFEENGDLEVLGAGVLLTSGFQFGDFDFYGALEPGIGYYDAPGAATTAFRGSVRLGVGLSLFALEGHWEWGYELDSTGALHREWNPTINLRFRIAPSWVKVPLQKLRGGG